MKWYLNARESAPTLQGQAAFVKSCPSDEILTEMVEAVKDARLVGWDIADMPTIEVRVLEEIDRVARINNTLVVVLAAQSVVIELLTRPLSNIVWSGSGRSV